MLRIFAINMQNELQKHKQAHILKVISSAFLFMIFGTITELFLLEHYEGALQLIPLICIGVSLLLVVLIYFNHSSQLIKLFKIFLWITALSGFYGSFLHLKANIEFEMEMKPTATVWDVFIDSFSGALPTLAPGSMIVLALLGYSYLLLINQKK